MQRHAPPHLSLLAEPTQGAADHTHSDDYLMLLTREGSTAAFDELVRRHQNRLLWLAYRWLGDASLATDVVQNTFMELYDAVPRYEAQGKFRSYVYRILLNQCKGVRRRQKIEVRAVHHATAFQQQAVDGVAALEARREVASLVASLSTKLEAVVLLRFAGDLSYQEIATVLGVPLGTVRRRLHDALLRLRELLEDT